MFKKNYLLLAALAVALVFSSCNTTGETTLSEVEDATKKVVKQTFTNEKGNALEILFDNAKDTATVFFQNEKAVLKRQTSASGFRYTNDEYELVGKGTDVELIKNGKKVFEHQDDIVFIEAKNKKGDTLNMTFNNTQGTVKAYLNGGNQIDLVEEKAASGIWYNNDSYELRGKGEHYTLTKNGKVIFQN